MKTQLIRIKSGTQFIGEALHNQLPKNCIFDKGKVGAGGTTIALTNNENYVVCVPYISLINNKIEQSRNNSLYPYSILKVTGKTLIRDIKTYMMKNRVKKIMVTYDSLHKLKRWAKELNLLIDEYHLFFTKYVFRNEAVTGVLNLFTTFKSYTFMTATVLEDEFILDELKNIKKVEAKWEDVIEIKVNPVQAKNGVIKSTVTMIERFLNGEIKGNAYIFVNSIDFIKKLINTCKLDESNTRLLYSDSNKVDLPIKRGKTTDKPKKIQLITSAAFEGVDLYDKEGRMIVISDPSKAHTLIDISTSLQQIAGRIRDTKYFDEIWHLYTNTRYSNNLTYDEFLESVNQGIKVSKRRIETFNKIIDEDRKVINVDSHSEYFVKVDNKFKFDENRVKYDLYNFKIKKHIYKTKINLIKEYQKNSLKVENHYLDDSKVIINTDDIGENFEDTVLKVKSVLNIAYDLSRESILEGAYKKYPFLEKAIETIRFEGIESLNFNVTNIKRKLVNSDLNTTSNVKVFRRLKLEPNIRIGDFIPTNKIKETFKRIYSELGIKKAAKGSCISEYFEVNNTSKRYNNKVTKGCIIIRPKFVLG
ncbi:hypothetical protein SAMN04488057_117105 [Cyclobacterium lianum]|uniref:Uncharacterized protein n=1 Tax=Cyclobacterium lianum TaxID=388280 RepID=A0A1M7QFL1_9BACT|nr:hypothetical protein [Cyclobacterium lianum]SHN29811.1 hypothetical protein SAMN04488057_117105 [Cyclobacterium lianum]